MGDAATPGDSSAADPDVVVLGAGINGAALARELVLNGAGVVVADRCDVASGTTRWSTRLVHGGLRYLEFGEVGLVRESLAERDRLSRLAPHLVQPLGFAIPLRRRLGGMTAALSRIVGLESLARRFRGERGAIVVSCGLWLYDLLSVGSAWPRHRMVRATAAGCPRFDPARYPLAAFYTDARMPLPERFTIELLLDAASLARERGVPFAVRTRVEARLEGRHVRLRGAGRPEEVIRPRAIVNATGAWVDRTNREVGIPPGPRGNLVGGTKGSHLVVDHPPLRSALGERGVYAEAADGRPVFVLPFGRRTVLVGTTDIPFHGDPATARADDPEIDYLLASVATLFPHAAPARGDVVQHYSGIRPLPASGHDSAAPAGITRRHLLVPMRGTPVPTWSIVGGKLTTCRSLAEHAAAEILPAIGRRVTESSRDRPLPGASSAERRESLVATIAAAARRTGVADREAAECAAAAAGLFGARAARLPGIGPGSDDRSAARLLRPLAGVSLPAAAVHLCLEEEWAETLEDVVERRLGLPFVEGFSRDTIRAVAEEMAAAGRLDAPSVEAAVADLASGLESRHGMRLAATG